jgi:ERCC4-type nuclease
MQSIIRCPSWKDQKVVIEELTSGDFVFAYWNTTTSEWHRMVGWESKTYSDLLSSLSGDIKTGKGKKRLLQQVTLLQAAYPVAGLLIKGVLRTTDTPSENPLDASIVLGGKITKWHVKTVRGLCLSIQDRGMRVEVVEEEGDLPYVLRWLHDHYANHRFDSDHFASGSNVPIAMLDSVPGVTPQRAKELHTTFDPDPNSIGGVIATSLEDLERVVNGRTAQEIYRRLH